MEARINNNKSYHLQWVRKGKIIVELCQPLLQSDAINKARGGFESRVLGQQGRIPPREVLTKGKLLLWLKPHTVGDHIKGHLNLIHQVAIAS